MNKRKRLAEAKRIWEHGHVRIERDHTLDAMAYAMGWSFGPDVIITDGYEVTTEPAQLPEPRD